MYHSSCWHRVFPLLLVVLSGVDVLGQAGVFTVNVGGTPPPPTSLVQHAASWHYRKGASAPQADWKTAAHTALDATWLTGPGGFGYEDGDDATVLTDMLNGYTTLYLRQSFEITEAIDSLRRLRLIMDWDDGFVAWLDGVEVARSSNIPGEPGTEPNFSAVSLPPNHEASAGAGGNAPTTYDLGAVGDRLPPGTHVLAVMGLNGALDSSDFSLIADLSLVGGQGTLGGGVFFTITSTNSIQLFGTNTLPMSTRVVANGEEATLDTGTGLWSKTHALVPGMNRLFIAALDSTGGILASTNRDVLYESSTTEVGGIFSANSIWDGTGGTIRVTNTVVIPDGISLNLTNGVVVLLSSGASIRATTNGTVLGTGTEANPIVFAPADGTTPWAELEALGTNAAVTVRYAEVIAGRMRAVNGGSLLIEDSVARDLPVANREIIAAVGGAGLILRRSYAARFSEVDARDTPVLIEDCLLEQFTVDGLDIKTTNNAPLVVRRTTLRFADPNNDNADAVDFGPGAGTVEHCLIHGFPDKGVSIGGASGTTVRYSLIYDCGIGLSAYSSSNCIFLNDTIAHCAEGILFRDNPQPAVGLGTNLIVWGNTNNVVVTDTSALDLSYSDIQGTNWPGVGNISTDPLFSSAAAGDYRLQEDSPCRRAGAGDVDMGATFPVGGIPSTPINLAAVMSGTNPVALAWVDTADNETAFHIQASNDGRIWWDAGEAPANTNGFVDNAGLMDVRYFYRIRATNTSGFSRYSNIASGIREVTTIVVGGVLPASAAWSGMILAISDVIVPTNVALTILPGTRVRLTNGASIRAIAGGTIDIAGTASSKVTIMGVDGTNRWGELSAQFTGASLIVRHADISRRQTTVYSNAFGLFEDSYFHDYRLTAGGPTLTPLNQPLLLTHFAAPVTVRRCHFREYYETLFRNGVMAIEDCLFENISGDGLDFDAAQPGTVLRRCTFRHGDRGNVDAVDVGPAELGGSRDVVIEDCLMYDFPFDKGISVGDAPSRATGTVVRNCLIYDCLAGVQAKDDCHVGVLNCTIVDNRWGFTNYNKVNPSADSGGGHITNAYSNILWNNDIAISMWNTGTLTADHCDFGATNWPGDGNINANPLFVNAAERDYRLAPGSPCLGTGRDGADMGAYFPVGAPMAPSHPRIESFEIESDEAVVRFWADSEKSYSLSCSDAVNGGTWTKVADVNTNTLPAFLSITNTVAPASRFYRLVTPSQPF